MDEFPCGHEDYLEAVDTILTTGTRLPKEVIAMIKTFIPVQGDCHRCGQWGVLFYTPIDYHFTCVDCKSQVFYDCAHCGMASPREDKVSDYCHECMEEGIAVLCEKCDDFHLHEETTRVRVDFMTDETWCFTCADIFGFNCDSCHRPTSYDYHGGNHECQDCTDDDE
jgi:hypothetical protein